MTALDAGCGPGRVTVPLAIGVGPSGRVVAIDTQEGMLRKAAAKAQRARVANIEFRRHALGQGHSIEGQFDRAVLVTVLGEIPSQQAALEEIFDCLVHGGILAITEVIADPHFQRLRKVRELISRAGFRERKMLGSSISFTIYAEKPALR